MTTPQHEIHMLIDTDQLKQDLQIDPHDLNASIRQHTGLYGHYLILAGKGRRQRDAAKNRFAAMENALNAHYRKALKAENPKTTEGEISAAVGRDARYRAAQDQLAEAEHVAYVCDMAMYAMNQRRDMLQLLAREAPVNRAGSMTVMDPSFSGGRAALASAQRESLLETMRRNEQGSGASAEVPVSQD